MDRLKRLRSVPDNQRSEETRQLARAIRDLPATPNNRQPAASLAGLSTEGNYGRETLQEVTTTLADSLREPPLPPNPQGRVAIPYVTLA